ncbi:site-specific DNA-methyltransferase [Lebetimonas sp. JH292]|uniref:DNA-methyltransferase n=1 Tax=Lebetimonas sp. JH292 TaxID=990068 RepID=UPI000465538F|nr:site-specific DNA-methyltransferase [Lebetimonas sp. JH292]
MQLNKIYYDNCLNVLNDKNKIEDNSIQLIFADPPYNLSGNGLKLVGNKTGGDYFMVNEAWDKMSFEEYKDFTNKWIKACKRILKENGSIFICCSYHNIGECTMGLKENGFKINNIITWQKTNAMPNLTRRVLTHSTEFIIWAVKGKNWIFNYEILKELNPERTKDGRKKQLRDVWQIPLCQGKERLKDENGKALHPTQKPEELLKRIILGFSNEGDIVFDPFAGSGTTPYVAKKYNRKFIAIEKEKKYYKAILKRLGEFYIDNITDKRKEKTLFDFVN